MKKAIANIICSICVLCAILVVTPRAQAAVIEDGNTTVVQELFLNGYVEVAASSKDEATAICHDVQAYIDAISATSETRKVTARYYKDSNMLKLKLEKAQTEDFAEDELLSLYNEAGSTVESINAFIVEKLSYDKEAAKNAESLTLASQQLTAKGALSDGKAVCQGYSNLFTLLAEHAGIESIKVRGHINGAYHVMNVVRTEQGLLLAADITSNDSTGKNWSLISFEKYCEAIGFVPEINVETAFSLKYAD